MKVRLHTQGWIGSASKGEGEQATASIHVLLEIDGHLIANVSRAALVASNEEFTKLVVTLTPGEVETVVHDRESWRALVQDADDSKGSVKRRWYREGFRREAQPPSA